MWMDNCVCCNCENHVFVPLESDKCPKCGAIGTLKWFDEDNPEIEV